MISPVFPYRALVVLLSIGTLLSGCAWVSRDEVAHVESDDAPAPLPSTPDDWMAEQAAFTVVLDPSQSDVAEFNRKEQFAIGQKHPVTHIQVKLVWLEEDLTDAQRALFDRSGKKVEGSTEHVMIFHFRFDQSSLDPNELKKLKALLGKLRKPPHKILVTGRTDSVGTEAYNLRLSEKRAWAVREALVAHGADPDSIILRAYGESRPIADNDTDKGRAKNRSVIVRWVKDGSKENTQ